MASEQPEQSDEAHSLTNAPNLLTFFRIALVPVIVGLLFLRDERWDTIAGILFGIASITDYFDGYLARKQKLESIFGKLMDPLADKLLVVSGLIMLLYLGRVHPILVILLISREFAVTSLRAVASAEGLIIHASLSAKWKTATQMFAIPFIMAQRGLFGLPLGEIGYVLIYISLAISLWSAKSYLLGFFRALRERRLQRKAKRQERAKGRLARPT